MDKRFQQWSILFKSSQRSLDMHFLATFYLESESHESNPCFTYCKTNNNVNLTIFEIQQQRLIYCYESLQDMQWIKIFFLVMKRHCYSLLACKRWIFLTTSRIACSPYRFKVNEKEMSGNFKTTQRYGCVHVSPTLLNQKLYKIGFESYGNF